MEINGSTGPFTAPIRFQGRNRRCPRVRIVNARYGRKYPTGYSVECGDLWLNDAKQIKSRYRAGSRIYEIKDPLLGSGELIITALAMADAEGIIRSRIDKYS
jgi:hypothetical protein